MTLKELAEHPERASEKDLKILEESIRLMDQLKKQIDYTTYGVTENSGRTKDEIAKEYYMETMLLAAILEAFVSKQELEYKDINKFVFNYTDNAFIWDVPIPTYHKCLLKLCSIHLLKVEKEDTYNPTFSITDKGYTALQQQTYTSLAQTALFNLKTQRLNDQALELSKQSVQQNRLMLIVAFFSAIVAIISVITAVIK
ncbi:MAG: hypothetical protein IKT74_06895 [Bacteroidales bacterium]|nr:hypothetical protein [Bacteroidales bacterium]